MLARTTLALLSMSALACAAPVFADAYSIQVSIGAGPLSFALQSLERQTGIELLFDHALVSELQSAPIHGNLTIEAALRELLIGTNLTVRRAQSGAWIIERPAAPVLAQPDAAVPEILIVGQRTQNADIRRVENDVQPYTIVTGEQMLSAHRDNLDQYFASRITSNTQVIPAGLSQDGNTLSEINLRGLGSQDTLVLVDGRRMPGIPSALSAAEFRQSDINAIPLHAIKRIEVLTGVAGGIYGFGALGGVVNVVLDRESRGVDLYVTEGLSSRGDGHRQGVEARFDHTSHDGATDFVVFAAHSQEDSILAGDREFEMRDRKETFDVAPQYYGLPFPDANSASIQSTFRLDLVNLTFVLHPDLTFKPEFGGATLSSYRTFLPVGFSGNTAALVTSLTQNAGQTDFSLTDRAAKVDLGSNPRSDALLANVRHRFGAGLEAFADAMVLRSRGESHFDPQRVTPDGRAILDPESPANPFTDQIEVDFPVESLLGERFEKHVESTRYTGGLVAELPFDWRGTAEIG